MADLDDLLPQVLPDVMGCPDPTVIIALRNALIEFCRDSLYWAVDADPIDVVAGTHTYDLESPESDSIVTSILMISHNDIPLDPTSEDLLDLQWPSFARKYKNILNSGLSDPWRLLSVDQAVMYYQPNSRTIRLVGIPSVAAVDAIKLKVSLIPSPDSEEIADIIYEDYHEAIAHGALYRLMGQSKKDWTDREGAMFHKALFDQKISEAKTKRLSGFTRQDKVATRTTSYY